MKVDNINALVLINNTLIVGPAVPTNLPDKTNQIAYYYAKPQKDIIAYTGYEANKFRNTHVESGRLQRRNIHRPGEKIDLYV